MAPSPQAPQPCLGPGSQLLVCPGTCWRGRSCTRGQSTGPSRTPEQEEPSEPAPPDTCQPTLPSLGPLLNQPAAAWSHLLWGLWRLQGQGRGTQTPTGSPTQGRDRTDAVALTPRASLRAIGSLVQTPRVPVPSLAAVTQLRGPLLSPSPTWPALPVLRPSEATSPSRWPSPRCLLPRVGGDPSSPAPLSFPVRETGCSAEVPAGQRTTVLGRGLGGRGWGSWVFWVLGL